VTSEREALAVFVNREMKKRNWSTYDVVRESGGLIKSNSTVWNISQGIGREVKEKTLKGLSQAFKVSVDELRAIMSGHLEKNGFHESEFALMYKDVQNLNPKQKRDFRIAWEMAKDALRRIKEEGDK
jgi:transcriptional regulator with XRE-family HTH domain